MTQCSHLCCVQPQGLLLCLSTSRYYGAACRGSQYTGRRSGRTAAVNQRSEVAGTNRSEPSSAGTCPFPQLAPPHLAVTLHRPSWLLPLEERGSLVPQSASVSCKPPHKATNGVRLAALHLDPQLEFLLACICSPSDGETLSTDSDQTLSGFNMFWRSTLICFEIGPSLY